MFNQLPAFEFSTASQSSTTRNRGLAFRQVGALLLVARKGVEVV